jgi:hypothetical protein
MSAAIRFLRSGRVSSVGRPSSIQQSLHQRCSFSTAAVQNSVDVNSSEVIGSTLGVADLNAKESSAPSSNISDVDPAIPSFSPPQIRNVIRPSQGYNPNSPVDNAPYAPPMPLNTRNTGSTDPNTQLTPRQEFWERVEAEHHAKGRVLILKQYCTEERLAEMGLEDLAQIVHSFAEARYPDHQLFGLISTRLQDVVRN